MCQLGFSLTYFSPEIYENIESCPLWCTNSLERSSLSFRFGKVKKNALPGDPFLTLLAMLAQLLGKSTHHWREEIFWGFELFWGVCLMSLVADTV